jgi:conjugal transfer ATP-binding protein TraC
MAIKGPPGWVFARLALDPFSLAVFSSKGSTVENLKKRKEAGMSTVAALKDMVAKGEVS